VQRGTLPFTGQQLSFFLILGLALMMGGAMLRVTGRRRPGFAAESVYGTETPVAKPKRTSAPPASTDPLEVRRRLAQEAARLGGLTSGRRDGSDNWNFPAPPAV
jgi:LPXTG-motif cell wall-anchored protein